MTIEEMVRRFDLADGADYSHPGCVTTRNVDAAKAFGLKEYEAMIKANKPEILAYLKAAEEAKRKAAEERKAKIAAIPGLAEIRRLRAAWERWNRAFEASFEGENACGGMTNVKRPTQRVEDLLAKYPVAAAFLRAESEAYKSHYEHSAAGRAAMEKIIENPADYQRAIDEMEAEFSEITRRHAWD